MRLSENAHLLCYPRPSSLRRTSMYASFLGISEALQLDIFHQPLRCWFLDSFDVNRRLYGPHLLIPVTDLSSCRHLSFTMIDRMDKRLVTLF